MIGTFRICSRTICSTTLMMHNNMMVKQAVMLGKMLNKRLNKKKAGIRYPSLLSKVNVPSPYENVNSSRRLTALNKLYMESIIPMLTGGIYSNQLSQLGVEVSKVELTKTLDYLNIYWVSRKPDVPDTDIVEVLSEALRELQSQMGSVRYMSKLPFLRFVKDERLDNEIKLEKAFELADYGEDYEPLHMKKVYKHNSTPTIAVLPVMREDVLGLDYANIKGKIKANISKFKAINLHMGQLEDELENQKAGKHEAPEKLIPFDKKNFFKFYKRRRILALKMLKRGYYDN